MNLLDPAITHMENVNLSFMILISFMCFDFEQ